MTTEVIKGSAVDWPLVIGSFLQERSGSPNTIETYARTLEMFLRSVGRWPDEVDDNDIRHFAYEVGKDKAPSPSTSNLRLAVISAFFNWCIKHDYLYVNQAAKVARRTEPETPPQVLTVEQQKKLLRACPKTPAGLRDRAIITLLLLAGDRISEIMRLVKGDIKESNGSTSRQYYVTAKGGSSRWRDMPDPAWTAIMAQLTARGVEYTKIETEDRLFDVTTATFYANFKQRARKAKIPVELAHPHALRHTFLNRVLSQGGTLTEVQELAGWKDPATAANYIKLCNGARNRFWPGIAEELGLKA